MVSPSLKGDFAVRKKVAKIRWPPRLTPESNQLSSDQNRVNHHICPHWFHESHERDNSKELLRLHFEETPKYKHKAMEHIWVVNAKRRSGHRGTSGLNWWMNFTLWANSICDTPWVFLHGEQTNFVDMTGQKRWWRGVFEGDDSFCRLVPGIKEGDPFYVEFTERWKRYGHCMKLILCTNRGEFCGTHYAVENGRLTGKFVPDVSGTLTKCLTGGASVAMIRWDTKGCPNFKRVRYDVSKNGGTQQPWVFLLKVIILGCFGGTPIFGNTHIINHYEYSKESLIDKPGFNGMSPTFDE